MDWLEKELQKALTRREPPPGFADRVMERIPAGDRNTSRRWMAVAAAALIAMISAGGYEYDRAQRARREAETAKWQLVQALQITSQKLQLVQNKIVRKGEL
jgi:hypothetical protein